MEKSYTQALVHLKANSATLKKSVVAFSGILQSRAQDFLLGKHAQDWAAQGYSREDTITSLVLTLLHVTQAIYNTKTSLMFIAGSRA